MQADAPTAAPLHLPWNPRLAHLRGAAALLVLVFHVFHSFFGHWKPQPGFSGLGFIVEGHTGVTLFFVLSGYLFMSIAQHNHSTIAYGAFVRNRVLRIVPLYIVFFWVAISIGRDAFRPMDAFYLLFSNLGMATTSQQFITGAAWTIGVEFTFYLIFPFLARFAILGGLGYLPRLVLLLLLLKWGAYTVSERPTLMIYSTLLGRLDQFLVGMWVAQWVHAVLKPGLTPHKLSGLWLAGAALALWGALEWVSLQASYFFEPPRQPVWVVWPTLEALLWSGFLVAYLHWRASLGQLLDRWLARAGEISFSIYLWHALVIHALVLTVLPSLPRLLTLAPWHLWAVLLTLTTVALTWIIASLSHQVIEKPFSQLRATYAR